MLKILNLSIVAMGIFNCSLLTISASEETEGKKDRFEKVHDDIVRSQEAIADVIEACSQVNEAGEKVIETTRKLDTLCDRTVESLDDSSLCSVQ